MRVPIMQGIPRGAELDCEGIGAAAERGLVSAGGGREVRRGGRADDVGVAGEVYRDAVALFIAGTADVG
jgi:hypothetical protein